MNKEMLQIKVSTSGGAVLIEQDSGPDGTYHEQDVEGK